MTELNSYKMVDEDYCDNALCVIPSDVYLKSEADEVIRHQKYKRCLAMVEICDARYDEEDAKVNGHGASWDYTSKEMKYWERWCQRWLTIADKFKDTK